MSSEFFRPPLDYPRIPYDRVLSHGAEHYPENVAVIFREVSLTYRELEALTNRFARALTALGVAKGDRVCILSPNCPEYIIAFYAIARVGAVASPMNPSYREREIEYQLNDTEAIAIVVSQTSGSVRVLSPRPPERDEAEQRTKTAPHAPGSSDLDQRPLNSGARFSPKARIPSVASSVSKQMFCAMVSIWSAPRRSRSSLA